jgi:hypothetical protein
VLKVKVSQQFTFAGGCRLCQVVTYPSTRMCWVSVPTVTYWFWFYVLLFHPRPRSRVESKGIPTLTSSAPVGWAVVIISPSARSRVESKASQHWLCCLQVLCVVTHPAMSGRSWAKTQTPNFCPGSVGWAVLLKPLQAQECVESKGIPTAGLCWLCRRRAVIWPKHKLLCRRCVCI